MKVTERAVWGAVEKKRPLGSWGGPVPLSCGAAGRGSILLHVAHAGDPRVTWPGRAVAAPALLV